MAYVINKDCIECGACVNECPTDVIRPGSPYVVIPDGYGCIECGACFDICPVDAPNPE